MFAGLSIALAKEFLANLSSPQIVALESHMTKAEGFAKKATEEAQNVVAARAEQEKKMQDKAQSISDATIACGSNEPARRSRCDKGEALFCLAWGVRLHNGKPPKLEEAKAFMQKACAANVQHACTAIQGIDQQIAETRSKGDDLWAEVQRVGDDLATKRFQADLLRQFPNTYRTQISVGRMATFVSALVKEQYCPSKKEFIANASAADFSRRAALHCKDDPPTASGISGVQVTLTQQCRDALATLCP